MFSQTSLNFALTRARSRRSPAPEGRVNTKFNEEIGNVKGRARRADLPRPSSRVQCPAEALAGAVRGAARRARASKRMPRRRPPAAVTARRSRRRAHRGLHHRPARPVRARTPTRARNARDLHARRGRSHGRPRTRSARARGQLELRAHTGACTHALPAITVVVSAKFNEEIEMRRRPTALRETWERREGRTLTWPDTEHQAESAPQSRNPPSGCIPPQPRPSRRCCATSCCGSCGRATTASPRGCARRGGRYRRTPTTNG